MMRSLARTSSLPAAFSVTPLASAYITAMSHGKCKLFCHSCTLHGNRYSEAQAHSCIMLHLSQIPNSLLARACPIGIITIFLKKQNIRQREMIIQIFMKWAELMIRHCLQNYAQRVGESIEIASLDLLMVSPHSFPVNSKSKGSSWHVRSAACATYRAGCATELIVDGLRKVITDTLMVRSPSVYSKRVMHETTSGC